MKKYFAPDACILYFTKEDIMVVFSSGDASDVYRVDIGGAGMSSGGVGGSGNVIGGSLGDH